MVLVKIVYSSITGNTKEVSELLEVKLKAEGFEVKRKRCSDVDSTFFNDSEICIVATYTYGRGVLPFDFVEFFTEIKKRNLKGKYFGVIGTGDKKYGSNYCKSAYDFYDEFIKVGAIEGAKILCIENKINTESVRFLEQFIEELKEKYYREKLHDQ